MMNHITIHGRLTKDPELRQTQSGVAVCNFSVAVDRAYKNGEDKQTDFFNCVAWRGLGELIARNFHKGKEILVSGEMQSRRYEAGDGSARTSWELVASNMDFCGNKSDNATTIASAEFAPAEFEVDDDVKLPF